MNNSISQILALENLRSGSVRGPREVRARSVRGLFGVRARSARDLRGVRSGFLRDLFEGRPGSVRGSFGIRSRRSPKKFASPGGLRSSNMYNYRALIKILCFLNTFTY